MHIRLLNIGFVKQPDGSYFNQEYGITLTLAGPTNLIVETPDGQRSMTLETLEDSILKGVWS